MNKPRQTPEIDSRPVTFPAGSFDSETLQKGLDKIAAGASDKRDDAIKALMTSANRTPVEVPDSNTVPGYKTVERVIEIRPGLEITEIVQVFDTKSADASAESQADGGAAMPSDPVDESVVSKN